MKCATLSENPKQSQPYKPLPGESIKIALAKAVICRYSRKFGTSYDLFQYWEEQLLALVFQGTNWSFEEKNSCFIHALIPNEKIKNTIQNMI